MLFSAATYEKEAVQASFCLEETLSQIGSDGTRLAFDLITATGAIPWRQGWTRVQSLLQAIPEKPYRRP